MAGAIPSVSPSKPIRFGAWSIYRNDFTAHPDWRSVAWLYTHDEYDGPEDGRCGFEATVEDCISAIQEREADTPCGYCKGSGVEMFVGLNGYVRERDCSMCSA